MVYMGEYNFPFNFVQIVQSDRSKQEVTCTKPFAAIDKTAHKLLEMPPRRRDLNHARWGHVFLTPSIIPD